MMRTASIILLFAGWLAACAVEPMPEAADYLAEAEAAYAAADYATVLQATEAGLHVARHAPDSARLHYFSCMSHYSLGDWQAAQLHGRLALYRAQLGQEKALEAKYLTALTHLYITTQDYEQAYTMSSQAIALVDYVSDAQLLHNHLLFNHAMACGWTDRSQEALETFAQIDYAALTVRNQEAKAGWLPILHFKLNQWTEARQAIDAYFATYGHEDPFGNLKHRYKTLGWIETHEGNTLAAMAAYKQALALDPGYAYPYLKLAQLAQAVGDGAGVLHYAQGLIDLPFAAKQTVDHEHTLKAYNLKIKALAEINPAQIAAVTEASDQYRAQVNAAAEARLRAYAADTDEIARQEKQVIADSEARARREIMRLEQGYKYLWGAMAGLLAAVLVMAWRWYRSEQKRRKVLGDVALAKLNQAIDLLP